MSRFERPNIQAMQGYTSGEQPNDGKTIKLNTNENPYPPSPTVQAALAAIDVASLRTYPQPTADPLRDTIARLHNLERQNVVITNGGDEALRLALTTFVEPGAVFGMAEPSYSLYPVLANIQDAKILKIDLTDDWQVPDTFCEDLNAANVALTCVVNPHAPSGTLLGVEQLEQLASGLNGVLLIDEAYADFVDPTIAYNAANLVQRYDNVLILRTFSKGYGLAGLRLGYLLGAASLIEPIIGKTRDSYNIDHLSQTLGLAAILDQPYAQQTWQQVRDEREQLVLNLGQLGLPCTPSQSNFLLAQVPTNSKIGAEQIYQALKQRGILVRYFAAPRLHDKLRITVGTQAQNQQLLVALGEILQDTN